MSVETRNHLLREHPGAYDCASRSGTLDQLFASHPNRGFGDGPIRDWNKERIIERSNKYMSAAEFRAGDRKAWSAAYRRGLLKELFAASQET